MAQQTEFIPYEQALELKELGFNEGCLDQYSTNGELWQLRVGFIIKNQSLAKASCSSPLYQQAFRWFREKYNLHHFIERDGYVYYAVCQHSFNEACKTYEEAELACLNRLIEIVKNK